MFRNTNIPSNRSWKLLKEERKIAHKLLMQQSNLCGFIDAFRIFAVASAIIIPLILLLKNIKKESN